MGNRRRRPLPGEGSDRLGSNFDRGLPGSGAPSEEIVYNVGVGGEGGGLPGDLSGYVEELLSLAVEQRRNFEIGHVPMRYAVASLLALPRLRACWPFTSIDENGTLFDLSGQGRDLTNQSALIDDGGLSDQVPVVDFLVGSRYLWRLDENGLNWDGLSALTVVGWVRPGWATQDFSYAPIVSKGDQDVQLEYAISVRRNSHRVRLSVADDDWLAPIALQEDAWNFVGASINSSGEGKVYVNGESVEDDIFTSPGTAVSTSDPFYIGRYDDGGNVDYWHGQMALMALTAGVVSDTALESFFEGTRRAFGV